MAWDSNIGQNLDQRISRNFDFHGRDILGMSPSVDSRLRIYSFDDHTLGIVGKERLSFNQWARVLNLIAKSEPMAIVVDSVFSTLVDEDDKSPEFLRMFNEIKTPIFTGSFVTQGVIAKGGVARKRSTLRMNNRMYDISEVDGPERPVFMVRGGKQKAFGPNSRLATKLNNVGHISHEGTGLTPAAFQINSDRILPHMTLMVFSDLVVRDRDIYVNQNPIHVGKNGFININFIHPKSLYSSHRVLGALHKKALKNGKSSVIKKGDIVLILPEMFTGHTDNTMTPYGLQAGGIVIASLLNSAINGRWLREVDNGFVVVAISSSLGAAAGMFLTTIWFFMAIVLGVLLWLGTDILVFSQFDLILPWLPSCLGMVVSGLVVFGKKSRNFEQQSRILRSSLEGLLPEQRLKALIENPDSIDTEFNEQEISIMFIDIVGFSVTAETKNPKIVFHELKKLLSSLGETTKEFGGVVDKSFGDGLLCYFGYRFGSEEPLFDHAQKSVLCAIKMQEDNTADVLRAHEEGRPIFPLRIGINTAPAFVGNVGTNDRMDFTAIGSGVNFAKRLESGCELYTVLFSEETFKGLESGVLAKDALTTRFIQVKHQTDLQQAIEFNPFFSRQRFRQSAFEAYRKYVPSDRISPRWKITSEDIILCLEDKKITVFDFSTKGIAINLDVLMTKGDQLELRIYDLGSAAIEELERHNVRTITGEVRWTTRIGEYFVHGLLVTNLSEGQATILEKVFFEIAFPLNSEET